GHPWPRLACAERSGRGRPPRPAYPPAEAWMGLSDLAPMYRRAGGALLRAAQVPLTNTPGWWPSPDDAEACAGWRAEAGRLPGFAVAVRHASTSLGDRVDAVLAGEPVEAAQVRRAAAAVVRTPLSCSRHRPPRRT